MPEEPARAAQLQERDDERVEGHERERLALVVGHELDDAEEDVERGEGDGGAPQALVAAAQPGADVEARDAHGEGPRAALRTTAPIAWRRVAPVAAALAGSLVWLVPTDGYVVIGYPVAFLLFYSVALQRNDIRIVAAVALVGVTIALVAAAVRHEPIGEYFGGVLAVLAPAGVGRLVRRERARQRRLEELAWHLERERERSAHAAVVEERARIARELHDVVSHGVTAIAVQSDAAEAALDHDPELARAPLRSIQGSARDALGEMRRLLGMLRDDDDAVDHAPLPVLADVPALVERAREAGMAVGLEVRGEPRCLPAGEELSVYRIVQEALTNVRKHAPGASARVRLTWSADALDISVRDDGPGMNGAARGLASEGRHGLVGLRERARLLGGELHAGAASGGGFELRAVIPLRDGG